jgi:hypothetical protein
MDDQCNVGVCDEGADSCVAQPANQGLACDDGLYCNAGEFCNAGVCGGGIAVDCSALDDQCNAGVCNEAIDACEAQPANEGLACDDGLYCNAGETCNAGVCTGGAAMDCSAMDDQCNAGVCNETTDACEVQPANEGLSCDDGAFCTTGETCSAGVCDGGGPTDCSALDDQCNAGICDEASDSCVSDSFADGTSCDDGDSCAGDTCQSGVCVPADCAPTAPTGLTGKFAKKRVTLTWNSNPEPDLLRYSVYRSTSPGGPYVHLADRKPNQPRYSDRSIPGSFCYVVTATNTAGLESGYSNEVCGVVTSSHKRLSAR